MKTKLLLSTLALTAGLVFGGIVLPSTTAEAKIHYTKMPKSFIGTWVNASNEKYGKKTYHYRETLKISKYAYHFQYVVNGRTITKFTWSGKKKSDFYKHSNLGVKKEKNGRWRISQYGMNSDFAETYKRVNHNGRQALVSFDTYDDGSPFHLYYDKK